MRLVYFIHWFLVNFYLSHELWRCVTLKQSVPTSFKGHIYVFRFRRNSKKPKYERQAGKGAMKLGEIRGRKVCSFEPAEGANYRINGQRGVWARPWEWCWTHWCVLLLITQLKRSWKEEAVIFCMHINNCADGVAQPCVAIVIGRCCSGCTLHALWWG